MGTCPAAPVGVPVEASQNPAKNQSPNLPGLDGGCSENRQRMVFDRDDGIPSFGEHLPPIPHPGFFFLFFF